MAHEGSDMKQLLYGCEDDNIHYVPIDSGKKRFAMEANEVPYATVEQDPKKVFLKSYTKKAEKEHFQDKVGCNRLFDPDVYLNNCAKLAELRESSMRNFAGNGEILKHPSATDGKAAETTAASENHNC